MHSMPDARVGIVVRTKNRPAFLRRALADIAAQDYAHYGVVVINDGGPSAAVDDAVAGSPAAVRDRVQVIHHESALGRSSAANAGVAAAPGEYVVLHDDDDLWHPEFLSRTVSLLDSHPGVGGVMARTEIVYEREDGGAFTELRRAPYWPQMTHVRYADFLQVNRAVPIGVLYRRSVHDDVGLYREDLHAVEDWEFYLRALLAFPFEFLDGDPLAYWMQRVGSVGESANSMFALAAEHERFDGVVRDEALRVFVRQWGAGLPLYLAKYIETEVARQLAERAGLGQRIVRRIREWRTGRLTR